MAYKVVVDYIGIPHFYAQCQGCSWSWENHREREKGIREIKKHVAKTGHTVSLEKAVCTEYVAAQPLRAVDGGDAGESENDGE